MTRGPEQQRLSRYLEPENRATLRTAAAQWRAGQDLLVDVGMQLIAMADTMATSTDDEFRGHAADATRASFQRSARAMSAKAAQMGQGAQAFDDSASALDEAVTERDALGSDDGSGPPTRPTTTPGSTDPADVRAQRDYDTAVAAYWDRYHADEQRATDTMAKLDRRHTEAGQVFKSIHGEREPEVPPPWPPPDGDGTDATGGTGHTSGSTTQHAVLTPVTHHDTDQTDQTDHPDPVTTDPGTDDDPVPGDPAGPSGTTGPTTTTPATTASTGTSGSTPPAGIGGTGPATGGAVAAGLGVGVVGGLTGGLTGGLALPGGVGGGLGGGSANGGRGIGGAGVRGAGSPVLGRGGSSGMVGVGNGAGASGRGSGRSSRSAAGGARGQARGSAGSRGTVGGTGTGTGTGSGRGRDKRRHGDDHELLDDGTDWLDDDGVYDGVID